MKIKMVDYKHNELITVKIELSKYMFLVAPEIIDRRFDYMKPRLMEIRNKYMEVFLENTDLCELYEKKIYDEMFDTLVEEAEKIHEEEGIMYYTI